MLRSNSTVISEVHNNGLRCGCSRHNFTCWLCTDVCCSTYMTRHTAVIVERSADKHCHTFDWCQQLLADNGGLRDTALASYFTQCLWSTSTDFSACRYDGAGVKLSCSSGDLYTNGRTTVIIRAPVVRHRYRTICYSRNLAHLRLA